MLLLAAVETPASYLLSMALFGAGSAFIGTAGSGVVGDVIHGRGGKPVAAFQMASDAGTFIGPLVGGLLADDYSFAVAFGATAAIAAVSVGAVAVMPETLPRRADRRPAAESGAASESAP
jgi:MFS family permease